MDKKQIELKEPLNNENDKILLKLDTSCEEILLDLDTDLNEQQNQKSNLQSQREEIEDQNKLSMEDGLKNDLIQLSIHIPTRNLTQMIKVKPRISIIELMKKVGNDLNLEKNKNYSFRAYGQDLYDLDKTLEEYDVRNESTIELKIPTEGGSYNSFDFSSMKNMEVEEPGEDQKSKPWRYARSGLNIPGICKNKKCEASNLQVICPQGNGRFNMAQVIIKLKCPQCLMRVPAEKDCYFWDCVYDIEGGYEVQKQKEIEIEEFEKLNQQCPKGKFVHFKATNQEDKKIWSYLNITTRKL